MWTTKNRYFPHRSWELCTAYSKGGLEALAQKFNPVLKSCFLYTSCSSLLFSCFIRLDWQGIGGTGHTKIPSCIGSNIALHFLFCYSKWVEVWSLSHQEKGKSLIGLRSGTSEVSDTLRRCLEPGMLVSDIRQTQTVKIPDLRSDNYGSDRELGLQTAEYCIIYVLSEIYNGRKLLHCCLQI